MASGGGTAGHPRGRWPELRQLANYVTPPAAPVPSGTRDQRGSTGPMPSGGYGRRPVPVAVEQRGSAGASHRRGEDRRARRWAEGAARQFWADRIADGRWPFRDLRPRSAQRCATSAPLMTRRIYPPVSLSHRLRGGGGGGWASRARCADLIERGEWAALAERAADATPRLTTGLRAWTRPGARRDRAARQLTACPPASCRAPRRPLRTASGVSRGPLDGGHQPPFADCRRGTRRTPPKRDRETPEQDRPSRAG